MGGSSFSSSRSSKSSQSSGGSSYSSGSSKSWESSDSDSGWSSFSSGSSNSWQSRSSPTSKNKSSSYSEEEDGAYIGPAVGSVRPSVGSVIAVVLAVVLFLVVVEIINCALEDAAKITETNRVPKNDPKIMEPKRVPKNDPKIMEPKRVPKISVLKLQVGLLGLGRSVQKDLNHIAEIADTSTSQGRHSMLSETILSILRHSDYCISAYSSVDVKKSIDEVEERFNQLSMEERRKFDEETLVNVNNIKKQRSTIPSSSGFRSEYVVVKTSFPFS
ncbi:FLUCTUATING-LIGHT-ACCLIMATION protein 1, chloroplastic-like [Henckelia pumila]|uniref:FLUCTUATING-LIGHT-ACCLIMATION protein 1, chloroplastic-like n=1 Tax=Henckelia pumila TaxID=405737 RepID=UPI003C6E0E22